MMNNAFMQRKLVLNQISGARVWPTIVVLDVVMGFMGIYTIFLLMEEVTLLDQ